MTGNSIRWKKTILNKKKSVLLLEGSNLRRRKKKTLSGTRFFSYVYNVNAVYLNIVYVTHWTKVCPFCRGRKLTPISGSESRISWSGLVQPICCCTVVNHFVSLKFCFLGVPHIFCSLWLQRKLSFGGWLYYFCLSFLSDMVGRTWTFLFLVCFVFLINPGLCLLEISLEMFYKTWIWGNLNFLESKI